MEWGFDSASLHLWIEEHFLCSQRWWVRWYVWAEIALWRTGWGEWPGGSGISPRTYTDWNTYLKWCQPLLPGWGNGPAQWDFHGIWNAPLSSLKTWISTYFYLISIALEALHSHLDCLWIKKEITTRAKSVVHKQENDNVLIWQLPHLLCPPAQHPPRPRYV